MPAVGYQAIHAAILDTVCEATLPLFPEERSRATMEMDLAWRHGSNLFADDSRFRDSWQACLEMSSDPRLRFLPSVQNAMGTGACLAAAVGRALHGRVTHATLGAGALHGAFNALLDGLLDDAPDTMIGQHEVVRWLGSKAALVAGDEPPPELQDHPHPVVRLALDVGLACVRYVHEAAASSQDAALRNTFQAAASEALDAEIASTTVQTMDSGISDRAAIDRGLRLKSEPSLHAQALVPVLGEGWPDHVAPDAFRACTRALGRMGGWFDDLRDIMEDLSQRRWNRVMLAMQPAGADGDAALAVLRCIMDPSSDRLVVDATLQEVRTALDLLPDAGLDHPAVWTLLARVARRSMAP